MARYDGTLAAIPNAAVLLSPMTTQEAVLSSRILGLDEAMKPKIAELTRSQYAHPRAGLDI